MNKRPGKVFIISAPSGAGKTTLSVAVKKKLSDSMPLSKVITYTTRRPRSDEQDGIDYHFVTPEEFKKLAREDFFLETNYYNKTWYGSPRSIIEESLQGKSFLIVLDPSGARSALIYAPDAVLIWITPPSIEVLRERLITRGTETPEEIENRLTIAQQELTNEKKNPLFHYHIINDDFNRALEEVGEVIGHELENS